MLEDKLSYKDFRTGHSFYSVRQLLKYEQNRKYRRGEYMFITRNTVLGRWHQIKKEMYKDYNG